MHQNGYNLLFHYKLHLKFTFQWVCVESRWCLAESLTPEGDQVWDGKQQPRWINIQMLFMVLVTFRRPREGKVPNHAELTLNCCLSFYWQPRGQWLREARPLTAPRGWQSTESASRECAGFSGLAAWACLLSKGCDLGLKTKGRNWKGIIRYFECFFTKMQMVKLIPLVPLLSQF